MKGIVHQQLRKEITRPVDKENLVVPFKQTLLNSCGLVRVYVFILYLAQVYKCFKFDS